MGKRRGTRVMSHNYLDYIREYNRAIASKCYICQDKTTDIIAKEYRIHFVCKTHFVLDQERREPTQICYAKA